VTFKIGIIVNPIAGIGGKKAWKGTDNIDEAWKIYERGERYAHNRVELALQSIPSDLPIKFLYCAEPMGAKLIDRFTFKKELVYQPSKLPTTAEDTKNACKVFLDKNVDLIIFGGGDGTARDIAQVVGTSKPILGIPSGVKMFSGCFLYYPQDLGRLIEGMISGAIEFKPEDVLDINEKLFRENKVEVKLYSTVITPNAEGLIQGGKISSSHTSLETFKGIANELYEQYDLFTGVTILGTGSSVYYTFKALGIEKTLLGVDILENGKLIHKDVDEEVLYKIVKDREIKIVLTPIGGQGFLLGRGNQQISARALNVAKKRELIVIATEEKIRQIKELQIDLEEKITFDNTQNGYIKVIVGYHLYTLKKLRIA